MAVWFIRSNCQIRIGHKIFSLDEKAELGCFMMIFLLLLMLRGKECGADTEGYLEWFSFYRSQKLSDLLSSFWNEDGYKLLNKLVGVFTDSPQLLIAVTSLICVVPLWYFYRRESEHAFLTVALFVAIAPFNMYFSGIRQALAMALAIPAWYFAKQKKPFLFLLCVFLAMQFHISAFIMLVMYPLYHVRITAKWLFAVVSLIAFVYLNNNVIFNFLLQFLWDDYSEATEVGAFSILVLLVLFSVYCYIIPEESELDADIIGMRNMLLFMVMIQSFAPVHPLSMRMNYYFFPLIPILIPKIINRCKVMYMQVAKLSMVVMAV